METKDLNIYGDSQLVIKMLLEEYKVKKDDLMSYHKYDLLLVDKLETVKLEDRSANKMADTLANLATTIALEAEESTNVISCNQLWCPLMKSSEKMSTGLVLKKWREKIGANHSWIICYIGSFLIIQAIR